MKLRADGDGFTVCREGRQVSPEPYATFDRQGFDPGQTLNDVDRGAAELEEATNRLSAAVRAAAEAEAAYDEAFEKQILTIYHEAKRAGERMPAEDVRKAIAHDAMDDGLYAAHLMAKANLAAADKRFTGLGKTLNARQSLLKAIGGQG